MPEGFGAGDCVIVADDVLQVIDFKYGVEVLVGAEKNPQIMCYALGAWSAFGHLYDIKAVRMILPYQYSIISVSTDLSEKRAEIISIFSIPHPCYCPLFQDNLYYEENLLRVEPFSPF